MPATIIIALLPEMIAWMTKLIEGISADAGTPAEQKIKLDAISADLKIVAADVAAVQLPNKP